MSEASEIASMFGGTVDPVAPPPQPAGEQVPSYDEWLKSQGGNFALKMNDLSFGEHNVKFLGVTMINSKFGISPEYHFDKDGTEYTLLSKQRKLSVLRGKEGTNVRVLKQMDEKGRNAWKVL